MLQTKRERINPEIHPTVDFNNGIPVRFILDMPVRGRKRNRIRVTREYPQMAATGFPLHFQRRKAVPEILKGRLRGYSRLHFPPHDGLVWMEDSRSEIFYPFLLKEDQSEFLQNLLVPANHGFGRPRFRNQNGHDHRSSFFSQRKYVVLENIIPAVVLKPMTQYYTAMAREGHGFWDTQHRRFYLSNDSVARFFHSQLKGFLQKVIGRPVKPSYTFASFYRRGGHLMKHVDRDQCEYTLSVNICDSPSGRSPWPLF